MKFRSSIRGLKIQIQIHKGFWGVLVCRVWVEGLVFRGVSGSCYLLVKPPVHLASKFEEG